MDNKLSDFEVMGKLGVGAYSTVYKVKRIADGEIYALKKVKLFDVGEREKQNAFNEVRIIASIKHPNIVSYKECFVDSTDPNAPELCIIMEMAEEGDLLVRIQTQIKQQIYIQENELWGILLQTLQGLKALHDRQIVHRDIKCANIFMYAGKKVKLGDFNVSKLAKKGLVYTQTGTPYYASPEVWQDKPYDQKADIWSLGCVIYEACTLKPPFRAKDMDSLYKAIMKGQYPPLPGIYSSDLQSVIKMMLQVKPENRPECGQILGLSFMQRKIQVSKFATVDSEQNSLLRTIKWPSSKKGLHQHKSEFVNLNLQLPGPNYIQPPKVLSQGNSNHIKKIIQSNGQISNVKTQEVQESINQTNEHIQNILIQIAPPSTQKKDDANFSQKFGQVKQSPRLHKIYPNIQANGDVTKDAINMRNKRKVKKLISEPGINLTKINSQRNNQSMNYNQNQSQNYSINGMDNTTEAYLDEGLLYDKLITIKKNSETVEVRRDRNSNSQHDRTELIKKNSVSKEKNSQLKLQQYNDVAQNYYIRQDVQGKQISSQKLPSLYQNSSYTRQHSSNIQTGVIEEEYQLENNNVASLDMRKKSQISLLDKKKSIRIMKKLLVKQQPYNVAEFNDKSNMSLLKDSVNNQSNCEDRISRRSQIYIMENEPLPKLQNQLYNVQRTKMG